MKKFKKYAKYLCIGLIILILAGVVAFKIYTGNYYRADEAIITAIEAGLESEVNSYSDDDGMVFLPENMDAKAVIVFYPGGKVEYSAYSGFMYELASRGYICLLPKMPENLAFLKINAAGSITHGHSKESEQVSDIEWYLAGHSLGGVAAASYLGGTDDEYAGLILCASYTTTDFSGSDIRLLSIYGSEDGVLNMDSYEKNRSNWPALSDEYVIGGGIHSYFGSYGIQSGDGEPKLTNEEQLAQAADVIDSWIEEGISDGL